jgi:hypothetical protein
MANTQAENTYSAPRDWSGEDMARAFANWVNRNGAAEFKEFADTLVLAEHRTLQQQGWQVFKHCIERWAKRGDLGEGRGYDLRNKQTVQECQKVRDLLHVDPMGDMWTFTTLI